MVKIFSNDFWIFFPLLFCFLFRHTTGGVDTITFFFQPLRKTVFVALVFFPCIKTRSAGFFFPCIRRILIIHGRALPFHGDQTLSSCLILSVCVFVTFEAKFRNISVDLPKGAPSIFSYKFPLPPPSCSDSWLGNCVVLHSPRSPRRQSGRRRNRFKTKRK